MSGRLGICIRCRKDVEGIYTLDVARGWVSDQYDFCTELCEACIVALLEFLKIPEATELNAADGFHVMVRAERARTVKIE